MSRIDHDSEKLGAEFVIGGLDDFPALGDVGEGLKLAASQKFDMPMFDSCSDGIRFSDCPCMNFCVLSNGPFKVFSGLGCCSFLHPFLNGS
ncbi:hypothetical protein N8703_01105 [Verrucomicrobia bacterium]|nr:hypothetical protein [Verrucomicrobiota bacterium]